MNIYTIQENFSFRLHYIHKEFYDFNFEKKLGLSTESQNLS